MDSPFRTTTLSDLINNYLWNPLEACCTEDIMSNVLTDFRAKYKGGVPKAVELFASKGQNINHKIVLPFSSRNPLYEVDSTIICNDAVKNHETGPIE